MAHLLQIPGLNANNVEHLNTLVETFAATMVADAGARKAAGDLVKALEAAVDQQSGLVGILLTIAGADHVDEAVRMAAAVALKNVTKNCWVPHQAEHVVMRHDKQALRQSIFPVMLACPPSVRRMLSEAVTLMAAHDFPREWPDIVTIVTGELERVRTEGITAANKDALLGTLSTGHSVFQRYRKEQELTEETKDEMLMINGHTAEILILSLVRGVELAESQLTSNPEVVTIAVQMIEATVEVLYDTTCLDLGEEHIKLLNEYMDALMRTLRLECESLVGSAWKAGPLVSMRSAAMSLLSMYVQKYDEEVEGFVGGFMHVVWDLIKSPSSGNPACDDLMVGALGFMQGIVRGIHRKLLDDANVLPQLIQDVVLPNLALSEEDQDCFETEEEVYIQRDIEGSNVHTRRLASCELCRALVDIYPHVLPTFLETATGLAAQNAWQAKDTCIYLITTLAFKGAASSTQRGAGTLNPAVPIGDFFSSTIIPELSSFTTDETVSTPIIKADVIRFVATFREHIPKEMYIPIIGWLTEWIANPSVVIQTYAAHTIERMLLVRDANGTPYVGANDLQPCAGKLLQNLCIRATTDKKLNEYTMMCLMRVVRCAPECVRPFVGDVVTAMMTPLASIIKVPSNPLFAHHLFEVLASCTAACPDQALAIEGLLWPYLIDGILVTDVVELLPYALQLLALLLRIRPEPQIPEHFMNLFAPMLTPSLYEHKGNVPALTRVLCAFICKDAAAVHAADPNFTTKILGVFQHLIASKREDNYGFEILTAMLLHYPREILDPLMPGALQILFNRMQVGRTSKYHKLLALFLCVVVAHHGEAYFSGAVEAIQAGMSVMVLDKIVLPIVPMVAGDLERKICTVALTELCSKSAIVQANGPLWAKCVLQILSVLHLGVQEDAEANHFTPQHHSVDDLQRTIEESSAGSKYVPLAGAAVAPEDPVAQVNDSAVHFRTQMVAMLQSNPQLQQLLQQNLPADAFNTLMGSLS